MPQPLFGLAVAIIFAFLSIIERQLDQLLSPLDSRGLPLGDLLRDLDAKEADTINWVLLPLAKQFPTADDVLPPKDLRRVSTAYNYLIAQVEVARFSAQQFETAKRNFHRFVTIGLLVFAAMGLVISAVPDEWTPYVVVAAVFFFGGLMVAAGHAFTLMRGARTLYGGTVTGLSGRLSRGAESATAPPIPEFEEARIDKK